MLPATGTLLVCFRGDAYDMFRFRSLNKAWGEHNLSNYSRNKWMCRVGFDSIPFIQFWVVICSCFCDLNIHSVLLATSSSIFLSHQISTSHQPTSSIFLSQQINIISLNIVGIMYDGTPGCTGRLAAIYVCGEIWIAKAQRLHDMNPVTSRALMG